MIVPVTAPPAAGAGGVAGAAVGVAAGAAVGVAAGVAVGVVVGVVAGIAVGVVVGVVAGIAVGVVAGEVVGVAVGDVVGGVVVGTVGAVVGAFVDVVEPPAPEGDAEVEAVPSASVSRLTTPEPTPSEGASATPVTPEKSRTPSTRAVGGCQLAAVMALNEMLICFQPLKSTEKRDSQRSFPAS